VAEPDPERLSRILLRLRHDFVMIGRGANRPLPDIIAQRLRPLLERLAADASDFLRKSGIALVQHHSPPTLQLEAALEAYTSGIIALRKEGAVLFQTKRRSASLRLVSGSNSFIEISRI
jgi:hypothetical protein